MKRTLINLLILIAVFGVGALAGYLVGRSTKTQRSEVVIPDSVIKKEENFIDSLRKLEKEIEKQKASLKDSIVYITEWKIEKINEVKELPLDSGILYLRKKLEENED